MSVFILSGFLLLMTFYLKKATSMHASDFVALFSPLVSKIGVDENELGQVAGDFVSRVENTGLNEQVDEQYNSFFPTQQSLSVNFDTDTASSSTQRPLLTIGLLADSHEDLALLEEAAKLDEIKQSDIVIHLGDLSNWGDVTTLQRSKNILDANLTNWVAIPGDHDLAQSSGLTNFNEVFEKNYYLIEQNGVSLLVFDNSANYTPIDQARMTFYDAAVEKADFVFLSQPIYHPKNPRVMGVIDGESNPQLSFQREHMLEQVRNSNVKAVISADHHLSSRNLDEVNKKLEHIVVGAITENRNLQQSRVAVLKIYENLDYTVEEVLVE